MWEIIEYQCVALPTLFCKNGETGKIEGYHLMYLPYLPYVCSTIPPYRVGGMGLVPMPTSHTTVRTVPYTAVPSIKA